MLMEFLSTHSDLRDIRAERALYMHDGNNKTFIIEERECKGLKKTFIFKYSQGYFSECHTEINTFDKYFALIPSSLYTEYIAF